MIRRPDGETRERIRSPSQVWVIPTWTLTAPTVPPRIEEILAMAESKSRMAAGTVVEVSLPDVPLPGRTIDRSRVSAPETTFYWRTTGLPQWLGAMRTDRKS